MCINSSVKDVIQYCRALKIKSVLVMLFDRWPLITEDSVANTWERPILGVQYTAGVDLGLIG